MAHTGLRRPPIGLCSNPLLRVAHLGLRLVTLTFVLLALLPPAVAVADDVDVLISNTLNPAELTMAPGTTVTFVNQDAERHRVRSVSGPAEFDSGNLEQGDSFSVTLTAEGTYEYVDDRDRDNSAYHGAITVATGQPPPGGTVPDPSPLPLAGDVSIIDRAYRPATIEVGVGASVSFANNDDRAHTVTAVDGSWDSGIFNAGGSYRRAFQTAGSFPYFCTIHPDMRGEVIVFSASGSPPPPSEPTPPPTTTTTTTTPPAPPGPAGVNIVDFDFTPSTRTVAVGTRVTWTNAGAAPHTVAADDGSFESGFLLTGDTFTKTFSSPGTFSYFCTLHPAMTATIVVDGTASGGVPVPPPPEPPPADASPATRPRRAGVSIIDNAFSPRGRTIAAGTSLTWTNDGALPHTVTDRDASFDSGFLTPGRSFQRTFSLPGVFDYFCTIHPGMTGTITVVDDAVAPSSDPPPGGAEDISSPVPAPSVSKGSSVAIIDNEFQPDVLDVVVGDTVTWANAGALPHTVTAGDGSFDSGFLMTGDGFSITVASPGRIDYFCTIHPGMVGAINVGASDPGVDPVEAVAGVTPGASASGDPPAGAAPADGAVQDRVRIIDLDYEPGITTVEAGAVVLWVNEGALPHTVTARDKIFDSGILAADEEYVRKFDRVGTFEYFCTLHPGMVGVIEVVAPTPVAVAGALPIGPAEPVSIWVALLLAGTILLAVIAFVVGMNRFGRLAELER